MRFRRVYRIFNLKNKEKGEAKEEDMKKALEKKELDKEMKSSEHVSDFVKKTL